MKYGVPIRRMKKINLRLPPLLYRRLKQLSASYPARWVNGRSINEEIVVALSFWCGEATKRANLMRKLARKRRYLEPSLAKRIPNWKKMSDKALNAAIELNLSAKLFETPGDARSEPN